MERRYCTQSGLLAGSSCPSTAVGYYRADDLPDTCTYSVSYTHLNGASAPQRKIGPCPRPAGVL